MSSFESIKDRLELIRDCIKYVTEETKARPRKSDGFLDVELVENVLLQVSGKIELLHHMDNACNQDYESVMFTLPSEESAVIIGLKAEVKTGFIDLDRSVNVLMGVHEEADYVEDWRNAL